MKDDASVTVLVATELLAELEQWSQPVEVKILATPGYGTGYELIARRRTPIAYHVRSLGVELTVDPADVDILYQDDS